MQAKIKLIDGGFCNSYLINIDGKYTLIDYGRHCKMQEALKDISVDRVLLTHAHRENSTDLYLYDKEVIAFGEEYGLLSDVAGYWQKYSRVYDDLGMPYVRPPIRQPSKVCKGEDCNIAPFIALNTPGHSPAHTVYLLDVDGVRYAFTGGLIYPGGKLPNLYDNEWDYGYMLGLKETVKSLRLLAEHKPDVLLPDRGGAIIDGTRELLEFADRLEEFSRFLLRDYQIFSEDGSKILDLPVDSGFPTKPTNVEGVDEISPHLLRVYANYSNLYIIICEDNTAFLVDCWANGYTGTNRLPKFTKMMETIAEQYNIKQYRCVLLSHYHGDHFLNYEEARKHFGAEFWVYENMVDVTEYPFRYKYLATLPWYNRGEGTDMTFFETKMPRTTVDRVLFDQETFKIVNQEITVFHLPGQTDMGCGFYMEIDGLRLAFTGDNIYYSPYEHISGHDCFTVGNRALPEKEGYLKCARVLKELAPDRLMCGHSHIIDKPMPQILRLEQFALKLINKLREFSPEPEYEWYADPFWVMPMGGIIAEDEQSCVIQVKLRNNSETATRFQGRVCLPEGFWCGENGFDVILQGNGRLTLAFTVRAERSLKPGIYPVTVDIQRNGVDFGELFDHVICIEGNGYKSSYDL